MLSLSRFSEFQEDGQVATCEVDGRVRYSLPSECDSVISRLIPFVSITCSIIGIIQLYYSIEI